MATRTVTIEREAPRIQAHGRPVAGFAFNWVFVVLCGWVIGGLYLDGWAHNHRNLDISLLGTFNPSQAYAPPGLPSTLTSWHALYYAGLLAITLVLCSVLIWNHRKGYAWTRALPAGYDAALAGVFLIVAGGALELAWPASFRGYPADILGSAALTVVFSPARLAEILGLALVVTAPLRGGWRRADASSPGRWTELLPPLLSLTFLLSVLTYVTQFAHPFVDPWAALSYWRRSLQQYRYGQFIFGESLGVLSILLQTVLLMGVILPVVRRWRLRPGSLTLVFTLNAFLVAFLQGYYAFILVAIAAGVIADVLLKQMNPPRVKPLEFHLFAFAVPAAYYLIYFLVLARLAGIAASWGTISRVVEPQPVEGIGWHLQLWTGTVLAAGLVGWLLSLLVLPSAVPADQRSDQAG